MKKHMWTTNIKAISEVNIILNQMAPSSLEKIPKNLLNEIKNNATINVDYIKPDISLENLPIEEETKEILAVISYNYFCDDEEKKVWNKELSENEKNYQEKQKELYNPDKIFNNTIDISKNIKPNNNTVTENSLTIHKETFFSKILNKIKRIFKSKPENN